ncbi:MAG TPA: division/cell wall cluster transcriptional repressor MraZ [Anaerolineales bacterium]|nr:division/cell wall cluster transcriptional repressor MraZ [Anaerolineales bacterium]
MFLGQYYHNLDGKGRLTIPARFRELLGEDAAYIMQGFDNNLMVLPTAAFEALTHRTNQTNLTDPAARLLRRLIFSTANHVEVDRAGRILVPQFLRQNSNLDSEAVVVGVGDYFEIWAPDRWSQQVDQLQDVEANAQRFLALDLSAS